MKPTIKIEGLRELDAALGQLPKATARNVLRRTLKKAGEPTAERARQLVPVNQGHLKRSITVSTKKPVGHGAGRQAFAAAMRAGATKAAAGAAARAANRTSADAFAEAFIGPGRYPHAHMVEFGTEKMAPQPYLRPAWDATKMKVLDIIKSELGSEISKAAKRLARKAARRSGGR